MNKNIPLLQTEYKRPVCLLRVLLATFIPRLVTLLLVSSFVLQPIARVSAAVDEPVTVPVELPVVVDEPALPIDPAPNTGVTPVVSSLSSTNSSTTPETSSSIVVAIAPLTVATSSPSTSDPLVNDDPVPVDETRLVDGVVDLPTEASSATSSSSTTDPAIAVLTVESDSVVRFDKSDCVAVADGSFYCQPKKAEPLKSEDGLFAYPDSDGDLEIYLQRNGELQQITFNQVDDAAPYFDAVSNTIVWHRQISERYQIMLYDISSGVETQLTTDTVNNMEPTRVGKYTAWQRWSGDNWDIVLFDGKETTVLTTALEHDIAPHIRGSLVVWNRIGRDQAQTIEIYDIQTGEYTTISDTDGGTISNPRMVLVYESSFENGDVVTKGYDMQTGEIADLTATPASVPDDIPPPDDTGQTRALIQGKVPTKEDLEQSGTTTPKIGFKPEPEPESTSTSSTSTLIIGTTPQTDIVPTVAATSSNLTLDMTATSSKVSEFDLVVTPFISSTTPSN